MPTSNKSSRLRVPGAQAVPSVQMTPTRSEEHTSELQSRLHLVCRLLLEKKKNPQVAVPALQRVRVQCNRFKFVVRHPRHQPIDLRLEPLPYGHAHATVWLECHCLRPVSH